MVNASVFIAFRRFVSRGLFDVSKYSKQVEDLVFIAFRRFVSRGLAVLS